MSDPVPDYLAAVELIRQLPGRFKSKEEVDAYIRALRDEWEDPRETPEFMAATAAQGRNLESVFEDIRSWQARHGVKECEFESLFRELSEED